MAPQYSYEIGNSFTATGTVSIDSGGGFPDEVVGAGTIFLTEFSAGDLITIGTETRVVDSVATDASLTVTANWGTTLTGQTAVGASLTNVESLTVPLPAPKGNVPITYSQYLDLGNGGVRGGGWQKTEWRWGELSSAQRDQLRTFCVGASDDVYIRTRKQNLTYGYYSVVMIVPQQEDRTAGRALDYTVQFRAMIELTVVP